MVSAVFRSWPARCALALAMLLCCAGVGRTEETPALLRARVFYNEGKYDNAIVAASLARRQGEWVDAASLVMARAHLEQYRLRANPDDLTAAREVLGSVHIDALDARDQIALLIALGESLYLGEIYGASAELFDTALVRGGMLTAHDRQLLLDWWATALDREAQTRPAAQRRPVFERMAGRMEEEVRLDPGNAPANYWLAVAARGLDDIDRAWNAAIAGWVRSNLSPETAATLREDLDRLVTDALIPERSRARPGREPEQVAAALRAEWDLVKAQWK